MIKRGILFLYIVLALGVYLLPDRVVAEEIQTGMNISNYPPVLITGIPNQIWAMNTNKTNAFDLDDYFQDDSGITRFYHSNLSNITITIHNITGIVSFYPDYNFSGTRNVTFYADDGIYNASSNEVILNVTEDRQPPTWSNPSKDKVDVYQNDFVTLSVNWEDDIELREFGLSVGQNGEWTNYPAVSFTGKENTSSTRIQISAYAGSMVYWRFYASDTSGNTNTTLFQNFTISGQTTPTPPSGGGGDDEDTAAERRTILQRVTSTIRERKNVEDFSIDPPEMIVYLYKEEVSTKFLKILNTGNILLYFDLSLEGIDEFASISEKNFNLSGGESKNIALDFLAKKRIPSDVFFGNLVVKANNKTKKVPITVEIKDKERELDLEINLPEYYKNVKPGQQIKPNITIRDIKDVKDEELTLYIAMKDFRGKILDLSEEKIKFSGYLSIEKTLTVPVGTKKGTYFIYARVEGDKKSSIDTETFEVGEKFDLKAFIQTNLFIITIIIILLVTTIFSIRYYREKERLRLLNLYVLVREIKTLIEQGKTEEALREYIKMKSMYGEKLSYAAIENKDKLKEEMMKMISKMEENKELLPLPAPKEENAPAKEENKPEGENKENNIIGKEDKKEEKKEDKKEEKKEDKKEEKKEDKKEDAKEKEGEKSGKKK